MNILESIDPELRAPLKAIPAQTQSLEALLAARRASESRTYPLPENSTVTVEDRKVDGVGIRLYLPPDSQTSSKEKRSALLWMHGGGYVLGSARMDDTRNAHLAQTLNCVVISVEYRLCPENPYPAPLDDCYSALTWLVNNAENLDIDSRKIILSGTSAGGGLAAGLALRVRDQGLPDNKDFSPQKLLLIAPMLDNRNETNSIQADVPLWNSVSNEIGWNAYLGSLANTHQPPAEAVPGRADSLEGLPPTFIAVGSVDGFLDENIDYARRLIAAGISVDLHVFPGVYHGADVFCPDAKIIHRMQKAICEAI